MRRPPPLPRLSYPLTNHQPPAGDPWRDATVSSDFHTRQSTPAQPIAEGDGFHCSDLLTANAVVDTTVRAVQTQGLAQMKTWLAEWRPAAHPARRRSAAPSRAGLGRFAKRAVQAAAPAVSAGAKRVNVWWRGAGVF